jgi:hypothetical protein
VQTGAIGLGLSSNVRAAYGFLVDNYDDGDEIFFFGFSRGAYTARAVAGLVLRLGLLTARGMDNFTTVYNDYYNKNSPSSSAPKHDYQNKDWRRQVGFREEPLPRFTVKIIGVWDTVGFHDTWLGRWLGEQLELPNTILYPEVQYAFHALSLDETRNTYKPILWHLPKVNDGQELLQVWFSGYHSDVGGGLDDPRLSDITLAWMVSQCTKHNQLGVNLDYFYHNPPKAVEAEDQPWATILGEANPPKWGIARVLASIRGHSARTPLQCPEGVDVSSITNEKVHESIKDRNLGSKRRPGYWPSGVVKGQGDDQSWLLVGGHALEKFTASRAEKELRGRIRKVHPNELD